MGGSTFKKVTGITTGKKLLGSVKKTFRPDIPGTPPVTQPTDFPEAVREAEPAAKVARSEEERQAEKRRRFQGRASTILTGPRGVTGAASTTAVGSVLTGKTKLGQ